MTAAPFLDTSVLAKLYVHEPDSTAWTRRVTQSESAQVNRIAILEFRSILGKWRRSGQVSRRDERAAWQTFQGDIMRGYLDVWPIEDRHVVAAIVLLDRVSDLGVGTVDAIHLAVALEHRASVFFTADRPQAAAAARVGLSVRSGP